MRLCLLFPTLFVPTVAACAAPSSGAHAGDGGMSSGASTARGDAAGSSATSRPSARGGSSATSASTETGASTASGAGRDGGGHSRDAAGDAAIPVGASVLQFHNHVNRDGVFVDDAITKVAAARFGRDTSFSGTFTGNVYASPLYVESGPSGKGTFFVATENGTIFAIDEATGSGVWHKNVGTAPTKTGAGCGNVSPIGITGTPAIDLTTRLIVFDSASANSGGAIATHTIYALSIDTGEVVWSLDAATLKDPSGITFSPQPQNQRGAVLIVGGLAYVVYGGHYGDCGDYHGWVIGVPLSGKGAKGWATQVRGAGIWGPGGAASDGDSIFVTTGNGIDDTASWAESEGIFRLDPGPSFTGAAADYFAAYDWSSLDDSDTDLSGSGPLVIDAPAMTPSALVLAQGKDGYLYLVDRTNMGGVATQSQPANVGALRVQSGQIINAGAWATVAGTTYVVVRPNGENGGVGCPSGTSGDLVAVKLDPTAANKMSVAWCASSHGVGSPSITMTTSGSDSLVWVFAADPGSAARLYAWDLATGAAVYSGGDAGDTSANVRRFTTPIVVHGRIFVAGDGQLYAYKPN